MQDESHLYADVTDGDATKLTSGAFGSAMILWAESGTGTKWAVVQLGGGLPQRGVLLPVLVWRDGGTTDGSKTAQCDRTYTAKGLDGSVTLGTGLTPKTVGVGARGFLRVRLRLTLRNPRGKRWPDSHSGWYRKRGQVT